MAAIKIPKYIRQNLCKDKEDILKSAQAENEAER